MLSTSRKPVAFLACANSYRKGKRLRHLVHERKAIAKTLGESRPALYLPVQKGNLPHHVHFNLLRKHDFFDRVEVLHFSGYADNNYLRLESDEFETPIGLNELSDLVASLPNLKVVFLNGCATAGLLDMLLRRDVPLVVATQTRDKDPRITGIAQHFYHHLAQGSPLLDVMDAVTASHPDIRPVEVRYEIEPDQFYHLDRSLPAEGQTVPWGMYFLDDNLPILRHKVAQRQHPVIPLPLHGRSRRQRLLARGLRYSLSVLLLGLLAVGITLLVKRPDEVIHLFAYWGMGI